jgi:hypothetical protein
LRLFGYVFLVLKNLILTGEIKELVDGTREMGQPVFREEALVKSELNDL